MGRLSKGEHWVWTSAMYWIVISIILISYSFFIGLDKENEMLNFLP
jgi:hypothetical protein